MYIRVRVYILKKDTLSTNSAYCCNNQCHFLYCYHKRDFEHLLRLTDSFTWKELPTRDPDICYVTKAGCNPIIQTLRYDTGLISYFHIIHSTFRIATNSKMILTSWFPFDTSAAPVYVFVKVKWAQEIQ